MGLLKRDNRWPTSSLGALAVILLGCSATGPGVTVESADLVFRGGAIYTLDESQPWAEAVAIRDGRIVHVGSQADAEAFIGKSTEIVNVGDGLLLPGFHDSHMHPMRAGNRFLRCQMAELDWPDQVLAALRECADNLRPGQWLRGTDLPDELFDSGVLNKRFLDEIAPDRPAFITNHPGYLAWVNSASLSVAGYDASTPDPEYGEIERDESDQPTGVLRFSALGPIYRNIPEPDEADLREALRQASLMTNGFGITSSSEAVLMPENWQAYVAMDRAGELTMRTQGSQSWEFTEGMDQLVAISERQAAHQSPHFQANFVKLFIDDSLFFNYGGALLEPYAGTTDNFGRLKAEHPQQVIDAVIAIDLAGLDVHMHSLGDRAVRLGLDAIEAAIAANPPRDRRHQIAHLALVHPDDLPRFKALNVTANVQALWAFLGEDREAEIKAVGEERGQHLYVIRSLLDAGARVVFGSDWISQSMNPLYSIQVAVTRRPPDGSSAAWLPEQRISLEEAIRAYTLEGAWLARHERLTGSIEAGKAADLVLLEKNLFEIDEMEISQVQVLRTLLDGRTVYRRKESQP